MHSPAEDRNRRRLLDDTNWTILDALQRNARIPYSELAKRVRLSVPATIERIRKLEDAGVITGYHAEVDTKAIGLPLIAMVRFSGTGSQLAALARRVQKIPQVLRAYRMSGDTCFLAVIASASTDRLEKLLDEISSYGQATTSIVVSSPVPLRFVDRAVCS